MQDEIEAYAKMKDEKMAKKPPKGSKILLDDDDIPPETTGAVPRA